MKQPGWSWRFQTNVPGILFHVRKRDGLETGWASPVSFSLLCLSSTLTHLVIYHEFLYMTADHKRTEQKSLSFRAHSKHNTITAAFAGLKQATEAKTQRKLQPQLVAGGVSWAWGDRKKYSSTSADQLVNTKLLWYTHANTCRPRASWFCRLNISILLFKEQENKECAPTHLDCLFSLDSKSTLNHSKEENTSVSF